MPPENVGHNPGDHYIENLIAETTDHCDSTLASAQPPHQQVGRNTPKDNLNLTSSLAIITNYYSNNQNDENYQHQSRQLPQQQQQIFCYPTDTRHPIAFLPIGNSTSVPTSASQFYSNHPTSFSNPSIPYQESSHAAPIAVSYSVPSNADPTRYYENYNYQYGNYHMVALAAPPQQFFQQQNGNQYFEYTNVGWSPYISPTEAISNPNIMYGDPANMMLSKMETSTAISTNSCAAVSELDATASFEPKYNDETTTSSAHGYSSFSGMNSSYHSIPVQDGDYHCNQNDVHDE